MSVHEVTVFQLREFIEAEGISLSETIDTAWLIQQQYPDHPVVFVPWNISRQFCVWLSEIESGTYNLPTEAQWEYACRAGTTTLYNTGNSVNNNQANIPLQTAHWPHTIEATHQHLRSVGRYEPNAWGLYDMHGNAAEWCLDWYSTNFYSTPDATRQNPVCTQREELPPGTHVYRGGSVFGAARSAGRTFPQSDDGNLGLGFRVVRTLE